MQRYNFKCDDCGCTICEAPRALPMLKIQNESVCVRCRIRIEKALEGFVVIQKGENRHPCADVLHEWVEGKDIVADCDGKHFNDVASAKSKLSGNYSLKKCIKPKEPIYEWQWCVIMDDGTGSIYGYHTEDRINGIFPERKKIKIESSKRERK